ncbi:MAG: ribosome biogenesis GTPase Der, partial [Planctomycetaceae bacterium]|nr:ribosome biogenesis GTPase Der [Planctomycetaceae bacterium]
TGGIGIVDSDDLSDDIERQIQLGLDECDLLLFVVDAKAGLTPLDEEVAQRVRRSGKPVLLVLNKCDSPKLDLEIGPFLKFGDLPYVTTSTKAQRNRSELLTEIIRHLPPASETETAEGDELLSPADMRIAVVGRRNVGKSTFINQLAECDRVIVSEVAGTTRDSIDIRFEVDGKAFVAIDTPGVRKKKSLANDIEFYGLVRAQRSIRRADLVLMFFDATRTISKVDKQLVEEINKHHKPCIFVINKWDLGLDKEMTSEKWGEYLGHAFGTMRYVPIAFLTARDGRNIRKLVNLAQSVFKQANQRISTGRLNRIVRMAIDRNPPPIRKNRRPKIYYASQVEGSPPTIVLKCNEPILFDDAWKRYFLGFLRETTPFREVPIRLVMRARGEADPDAAMGTSTSAGGADEDVDEELLTTDDMDADGEDFADEFPEESVDEPMDGEDDLDIPADNFVDE